MKRKAVWIGMVAFVSKWPAYTLNICFTYAFSIRIPSVLYASWPLPLPPASPLHASDPLSCPLSAPPSTSLLRRLSCPPTLLSGASERQQPSQRLLWGRAFPRHWRWTRWRRGLGSLLERAGIRGLSSSGSNHPGIFFLSLAFLSVVETGTYF